MEDEQGSLSDQIWRLNFVWWFDVSCTFQGLMPGNYIPLVHLKCTRSFADPSNAVQISLFLSKASSDSTIPLYTHSFNSYYDSSITDQWVWLQLPVVNVLDYIQNARLVMYEHGNSIVKSGLVLDCICMIPEAQVNSFLDLYSADPPAITSHDSSSASNGTGFLSGLWDLLTRN